MRGKHPTMRFLRKMSKASRVHESAMTHVFRVTSHGLYIATGAGIAIGQIMAGTVGPTYGWRLPFLLAAAPAILLAGILYATVKEPRRGSQEEAVKEREMGLRRERAARRRMEGSYGSAGARGSDDETETNDGAADGTGSKSGSCGEPGPEQSSLVVSLAPNGALSMAAPPIIAAAVGSTRPACEKLYVDTAAVDRTAMREVPVTTRCGMG